MARCKMFMRVIKFSFCVALAVAVFVWPWPAAEKGHRTCLGFTGPEIYPIDDRIGLLHAADLDGDGLNDLVVVNNLRSKINLLYNQTGRTNRA